MACEVDGLDEHQSVVGEDEQLSPVPASRIEQGRVPVLPGVGGHEDRAGGPSPRFGHRDVVTVAATTNKSSDPAIS